MFKLVDVFVAGLPKTKGSLVVRPNGTAHESVIGSPRWRALMAGAVRDSYRRHIGAGTLAEGTHPAPWKGPAQVHMHFGLPVDPLTAGAGDIDKLVRNVLDAIASNARNPRYRGYAIEDDNQVVSILASKSGPVGPNAGVSIEVWTTP